MNTQTKYSSAETGQLSKFEIEIPPMPRGNSATGKATHVFSIGKKPTKYTRKTLMKKSVTMSPRTDFFEKALLGIWLENKRQPVPYAFKTSDGSVRSLDAGCLGYLLNFQPPRLEVTEVDTDGHIVSVAPTDILRSQHKYLTDQKLQSAVISTQGHTKVNQIADGVEEFELSEHEKGLGESPLGFDPSEEIDERRRSLSNQVRRQGAQEFRKKMRSNWQSRCVITGSDILPALDAAHIHRYGGEATNDPRNGLLLRADVHRLFDRFLVSLSYYDGDLIFHISERLRGTDYEFIGEAQVPKNELPRLRPHIEVVAYHYRKFVRKNR